MGYCNYPSLLLFRQIVLEYGERGLTSVSHSIWGILFSHIHPSLLRNPSKNWCFMNVHLFIKNDLPALSRRRSEIEEHGKVMADAPSHDENMPDGVVISNLLQRVKDNSNRVDDTADSEQ
jgi:hypothetical protein